MRPVSNYLENPEMVKISFISMKINDFTNFCRKSGISLGISHACFMGDNALQHDDGERSDKDATK